jgi:lipoprotein-anchoring transpeptidase ErfK/SrfK
MRESRATLTRWLGRGVAATLALALIAWIGNEPPPPRAAPIRPAPEQGRVHDVPPLSGMAPGEVRSMLAVRSRLRYGQVIWNDAGVPDGPVTIRVDRAAQILSVFRGGHEIATTVILYGAPEKPTPAGRYPVLGKKPLHISSAYGAEMPYTLWLTRDGIAIHASDVRQGAATHGCIGVPKDFARRLYDLVRPGDPVVIA